MTDDDDDDNKDEDKDHDDNDNNDDDEDNSCVILSGCPLSSSSSLSFIQGDGAAR
jgi:hypothetical protein